MTDAIAVQDLRKSFGPVAAVAGLGFRVATGEVFGFLGPNGAGKSTTINLLTGLARADGGQVAIGGIDCTGNPRAAQALIGVVPDESNLYPELDGFTNLCFCGALYGMPRAAREARAKVLADALESSELRG
ncbi:MAG: ATP-binding cassette domain-containing protein, partial [Planctomycetota bacterium]